MPTSSSRQFLWKLCLGQVISLMIAGTGIFTTELSNIGVNFPALQISLTYMCLSLALCLEKGRRADANVQWWKYPLFAVLDVEANYLVVMAYKYTSITSIMLLDCFTIPSAMLLSKIFLKATYRPKHVFGASLSVCGLILTVVSDIWSVGNDDNASYPHALKGDLICIMGAFMYASSNVMEEAVVKASSQASFLGRVGAWGAALALAQSAALEPRAWGWGRGAGGWAGGGAAAAAAPAWAAPAALGWLAAFTAAMVATYLLVCWFLGAAGGDAALFNLSLLTSDVYAVAFAVAAEGRRLNWLYCASFATTLAGLLVYSRQRPPTGHLRGTAEEIKQSLLTVGRDNSFTLNNSHNHHDDNVKENDFFYHKGSGQVLKEESNRGGRRPSSSSAAAHWNTSRHDEEERGGEADGKHTTNNNSSITEKRNEW